MSRNLCMTSCYYCGATVALDEQPRRIRESETGCYFSEYEGMIVANATCIACCAQYLAWVDGAKRKQWPSRWGSEKPWPRVEEGDEDYARPRDLSFRSTFNDEPGVDDMPAYRVERAYVRRGAFGGEDWIKEHYPEKAAELKKRNERRWNALASSREVVVESDAVAEAKRRLESPSGK